MKRRTHPTYRPALLIFTLLATTLAILTTGCATPPKGQTPGDPRALEYSIQNFHTDFRWARYEQAAVFVAPAYKQTFLGRYEEHGEDYKIVDLTIKGITLEAEHAEIDVEQEWYKVPNMVVSKDRYIEVWKTIDNVWMLHDRVEREEYRKRKREAALAKSEEARPVKSAAVEEEDKEPGELEEPGEQQ